MLLSEVPLSDYLTEFCGASRPGLLHSFAVPCFQFLGGFGDPAFSSVRLLFGRPSLVWGHRWSHAVSVGSTVDAEGGVGVVSHVALEGQQIGKRDPLT